MVPKVFESLKFDCICVYAIYVLNVCVFFDHFNMDLGKEKDFFKQYVNVYNPCEKLFSCICMELSHSVSVHKIIITKAGSVVIILWTLTDIIFII